MSDKVRVEVDGAVRTVTLTRPEKGNAMDAEMLRALEAAFDPSPGPGAAERVAVVRAEGRVFCSGLDLRGSLGRDQDVESLFHRVETWPLPVLAIVQGAAIAGGNELALHCDLVVASSAARFGMSLAQVGLAPSWFLDLEEAAMPVSRPLRILSAVTVAAALGIGAGNAAAAPPPSRPSPSPRSSGCARPRAGPSCGRPTPSSAARRRSASEPRHDRTSVRSWRC